MVHGGADFFPFEPTIIIVRVPSIKIMVSFAQHRPKRDRHRIKNYHPFILDLNLLAVLIREEIYLLHFKCIIILNWYQTVQTFTFLPTLALPVKVLKCICNEFYRLYGVYLKLTFLLAMKTEEQLGLLFYLIQLGLNIFK